MNAADREQLGVVLSRSGARVIDRPPEPPPPYLGLSAVRDRAATHVFRARCWARRARWAIRSGWPDVGADYYRRAEHHLKVARWVRAGAPEYVP
jgi:hypothetical protein